MVDSQKLKCQIRLHFRTGSMRNQAVLEEWLLEAKDVNKLDES